MPLTKIEAEIEIPEGFEFDRLGTKTRDGDYSFEGYPIGCHSIEYITPRVILRKKQKPACRVYLDYRFRSTDIEIARVKIPPMNAGDWIEYGPPKKWPTPLVERIAAIDIKAAEWIMKNWDDLSTDKYNFGGRYSRDSENLKTMFSWAHSDIDSQVWYGIAKKLGEYL